MNEKTRQKRIREFLEKEASGPPTWWWLSFADESGFRGLAIVEAPGFATAIQKTHRLGINPGGEVQGDDIGGFVGRVPESFRNRLLSKAEALKLKGILNN